MTLLVPKNIQNNFLLLSTPARFPFSALTAVSEQSKTLLK